MEQKLNELIKINGEKSKEKIIVDTLDILQKYSLIGVSKIADGLICYM
jgi:hypothetical protein